MSNPSTVRKGFRGEAHDGSCSADGRLHSPGFEGRPLDSTRPTTAEFSVLAFFDVLGFSDLLHDLGLSKIYEIYEELTDMLDGMNEPGAFGFWVPADYDGNVDAQLAKATRGEDTQWAPAASLNGLSVAYFSDTILLWMRYDPIRCGAFVDMSISFFCRALSVGVPLRGALAIGELHMDSGRGIYLGTPIIEGARAEAAQSWCGFSLGPSFRSYPCIVPGDRFRAYTSHVKPGQDELVLPFGVDWTWHWREQFAEIPLESVAETLRRDRDDTYWAATLSFAEASAATRPTGLAIGP